LRIHAFFIIVLGLLGLMHLGANELFVEKNDAMCSYYTDFECVQRTNPKYSSEELKVATVNASTWSLDQVQSATTETVWQSDFGMSKFQIIGTNTTGDCEVNDALVGTFDEAMDWSKKFFEGFTPGLPDITAPTEIGCNEQALNLTRVPHPCHVSSGKIGSDRLCGYQSTEAIAAFNMWTLLVSAGLLLMGIIMCCYARQCVKRCGEGEDSRATALTIFPPEQRDALSTRVNSEEELQPLNGYHTDKPKGIGGIWTACCRCGRSTPGSLPR
jgi:hypothetical protein